MWIKDHTHISPHLVLPPAIRTPPLASALSNPTHTISQSSSPKAERKKENPTSLKYEDWQLWQHGRQQEKAVFVVKQRTRRGPATAKSQALHHQEVCRHAPLLA
ncbi:hypothetical protein D8674_015987 [Pyrus ussuriensis x Pyrus communis]|uniref:Uncharacterized protein n=1 Tax=Pyrus ussuriensis x Pyrus communis TaxID=2448454 RepID=A0A5N5HBN0_9ROSA|nr:hypothetical protein D8674_015987 [Pyrus ussuriensis x Pyrus communis]